MARELSNAEDAAPSAERRSNLLTFLIADVRGYSTFTSERGDEAAARLADRLAEMAEEVVARHDGQVVELRGDEVLAVFPSARNALRAALAMQGTSREAMARERDLPLSLGIGLDAGEAISVRGGYRGGALNLASRLSSLARGGEVLASDAVAHLARKIEGISYRDRGQVQVKGFADPISVLEIVEDQRPTVSAADGIVDEKDQPFEAPELPIGGFLGSLPSNTLVSREAELAQVLQAVDAVAGGAGRVVLLAGEPGAGKTRLAQEVTLRLRNQGFSLAAGSCFQSRQSVPYYPFLDILDTLSHLAPPDIRSQIPARWPYLGVLLPEAGITPPSSSANQDDQERLFRSITGFVQALAERAPLAILLDDLHWSDQSSLDLLGHLARHTRGSRVFLLGNYRDVEVGRQHPLERALHDLHRQRLTVRIPIRRLDQAGTAALMSAALGEEDVSPEFSSLIYRHTEGNPFFTQEVLLALMERGDVYRKDGHWDRRGIEEIEVPESVRAVIGQRLSNLPPETQEMLREASVLGQTFRFDDLAAMTLRDEDQIDALLTESVNANVVRLIEDDEYHFSHALMHGALYAELSPRRRRKLHRAAGEALEKLGARKREERVAELAWHFLEGEELERALPYVMKAGEHAEAIFAHGEAVSRFRTAVELARDIGDTAAEAEALEKLGGALEIQSRPDESLAILRAAAETYRELGDPSGEGRVTAGIASALMHLGQQAEAVASLRTMLGLLEASEPTVVLARLSVQLGAVLYGGGQYAEALHAVQRARQVAEALGDPVTQVAAENYRGAVLMQTGRLEEARQVFEAILPLSETIQDLGIRAHTVNDLAFTLLLSGRLSEAERYLQKAVELQRQKDSPVMIAFSLTGVSWIRFYLGRWQEARSANQEGMALVRGLPASWQIPFLLYTEGLIAAAEGDWEAASAHLQQAIDLSQGSHVILPIVHQVLANREILDGRPDLACARLEPFTEESGEYGFYVATMLPTLAWAHLERGALERAETIVSDLLGSVGKRFPITLVETLRVQGMILARRGQQPQAQRAFENAVSLAREMSYPFAEAAALHEWGVSESRLGDRAAAQEHLGEAFAIFQRLGALPAMQRTEQALRNLE